MNPFTRIWAKSCAKFWTVFICCAMSIAHSRSAEPPEFLKTIPLLSAEEVMDGPVGLIIVERFAKAMQESADLACVSGRSLTGAEFASAARKVLLGTHRAKMAFVFDAVDPKKAQAKFRQLAGSNSMNELTQLLLDPTVKAYLSLNRDAQQTHQAIEAIDDLERGMLLKYHSLKRRTSPLATGDVQVLALSEKQDDAIDVFTEKNKQKELKRYLRLAEYMRTAVLSAGSVEKAFKWGPGNLETVFVKPLDEHCVFGKIR